MPSMENRHKKVEAGRSIFEVIIQLSISGQAAAYCFLDY
jgi:hypothetical protein